LAQPHDESAARGQGQHGHQAKSPAGVEDEVAGLLEADGDAERLHRAQDDGDVARPLGDFLAPELALFLQLGQRLVDHRQQLQNDGRGNVGHDAQGENRETAQLPAGKQVHKPEEAAAVLLEKLRQLVGIHAGRGNVPTNAVNKQQSQGEQDAPAQVRNAENVRQFFKHYCKTSTLPPALVIFSCADLENLCALTVSATVSWPSPRILTGSLALITPALRSTSGVMVVSPKAARRSRLTMLYSLRKMLVKPRLGMRRCSGIWPPSKPRIMREPLRERWPLCPRVDVLPMPEPMPRPTRLRFSVAFFGARMLDKFISKPRFKVSKFQRFTVSRSR